MNYLKNFYLNVDDVEICISEEQYNRLCIDLLESQTGHTKYIKKKYEAKDGESVEVSYITIYLNTLDLLNVFKRNY